MELHPCLFGFSGISQETRLLFAYFHNIPFITTSGLLNFNLPDSPFLKILNLKHKQISQASKLILAAVKEKNNKFAFSEMVSIGIRLYFASTFNLLGITAALGTFESAGFEDFLWDQLFSKSLSKEEFKAVTKSVYRTLGFSPHALRLLRKYNARHLKINTSEYDVLFVQTPFPGAVSSKTQLVVRYHDAVPLMLPHLIHDSMFHQASHYKALCSNAKRGVFVCTSNDTREDLLRVFPQLEKRSQVIHDMIAKDYFAESADEQRLKQLIRNYSYEARRDLGSDERADDEFYAKSLADHLSYILIVSTIEPRKNHIRLIRAWERVRTRTKRALKLVFVGDLGWQTAPIVAVMKPWQQQGELFHLQKVPFEHLRLLYRGAACVVCPSIKEGFDLSGIEAMACQGLVAASAIPVHKEVYGAAALYFDPYSFENQAEVIELALTQGPNFTDLLREKGLIQAQKYQPKAILPQWEDFFARLKTT